MMPKDVDAWFCPCPYFNSLTVHSITCTILSGSNRKSHARSTRITLSSFLYTKGSGETHSADEMETV